MYLNFNSNIIFLDALASLKTMLDIDKVNHVFKIVRETMSDVKTI